MPRASEISAATRVGTKKMPPPMTLETTMAAPSRGPRRRSSDGEGRAFTRPLPASLRNQLPLDGHFADVRPLDGRVLGHELHQRIDELSVLEHVGPRVGPG